MAPDGFKTARAQKPLAEHSQLEAHPTSTFLLLLASGRAMSGDLGCARASRRSWPLLPWLVLKGHSTYDEVTFQTCNLAIQKTTTSLHYVQPRVTAALLAL